MTIDEFVNKAQKYIPENTSDKVIPLIKEKISNFGEIANVLETELSFVYKAASYPKESLKWKQEPDLVNTKEYLKTIIGMLENVNDFSLESVKSVIWPLAEAKGKGNVLWPMRYALSGKDKSPDPFTMSGILGKEETLKRLKFAYELL